MKRKKALLMIAEAEHQQSFFNALRFITSRSGFTPKNRSFSIALKQSIETGVSAVVESEYLAPIIDEFLVWVSRNRSPETLRWYQYRLQRFVNTFPRMRTDELKPINGERWGSSYKLNSFGK